MPSTSPLFARDSSGHVEVIGTVVFVAHAGRRYLLTASHVLRNYAHTHQISTGHETVISLNQPFFRSNDEDSCDIGFIPLTDEQQHILSDVRFLTVDDMNLSERPSEGLHYIVGYRGDDNTHNASASVFIAAWSVYGLRAAPLEIYTERHVSGADRLLLRFDRHRLVGPRGPIEPEPEPEGLSGSGTWNASAHADTDRLVALVDSHSDSGHLIYATRLREAIRALGIGSQG